MYKVFINNRPLILATAPWSGSYTPGTLFLKYDSPALLRELVVKAHTAPDFFRQIVVIHDSAKELMKDFIKNCKYIEAAGGRVWNANGQLLMIYRNGKWDLPKGKIEKRETPEIAAIREVQEECGLLNLRIKKELTPTYHTYIEKGKPILKKTWWYDMLADDRRKLKPQKEEGITQAAWLDDIGVYNALKNTFNSIIQVVEQ